MSKQVKIEDLSYVPCISVNTDWGTSEQHPKWLSRDTHHTCQFSTLPEGSCAYIGEGSGGTCDRNRFALPCSFAICDHPIVAEVVRCGELQPNPHSHMWKKQPA